ncbi:protein ytfJ [Salmonella bongori]|nr:protein ytfJ [Salmonella bongori]
MLSVAALKVIKKLYPWSQFIVDSNGVARNAWQLREESSAVVVLDKDGRVQWGKRWRINPARGTAGSQPAA